MACQAPRDCRDRPPSGHLFGLAISGKPVDRHDEFACPTGYDGSYPAFQRHLRLIRPAQVIDPEIRFETGPGLQTQADWTKLGLWRLGEQMV
jgi:hypothetical protein